MRIGFDAEKKQMPTNEYIDWLGFQQLDRRKFLANTGKILTGSIFSNPILKQIIQFHNGIKPRIAIIGAGIAGLNALHTFKKNGFDATVYESSNRVGGRIFTAQNAMGDNTWTEFGGEFIDSDHKDILSLAEEFELGILDTLQSSEKKLNTEAFFFGKRYRTMAEVVEGFRKILPKMKEVSDSLPENIDFRTKDPIAIKFDNLSMEEYLQSLDGDKWIIDLIKAAYEPEFGLDAADQSSLNLITLLTSDTSKDEIDLFGESDERFKIIGGNQSIPNALAKKYENNIELNLVLTSIRVEGENYFLSFSNKKEEVKADFTLVTIPFTKLREVDIKISLPDAKRSSINTLGYGINSKFMLGFNEHTWRKQGYAGLVYSDIGVCNGWDNTQLQTLDSNTAGLTVLLAGSQSLELKKRTLAENRDRYLPLWEQIYADLSIKHNGKMAQMIWETYPHTKASYICYKPGQYTSICGLEFENVGNLHFAGEHCGGKFSGYMNGAARSGREAAEAIIKKIN